MKLFLLLMWVLPFVGLIVGVTLGVANVLVGLAAGTVWGLIAYALNAVLAPGLLEGPWLMISQMLSLAGFLATLPWVIAVGALIGGGWQKIIRAS